MIDLQLTIQQLVYIHRGLVLRVQGLDMRSASGFMQEMRAIIPQIPIAPCHTGWLTASYSVLLHHKQEQLHQPGCPAAQHTALQTLVFPRQLLYADTQLFVSLRSTASTGVQTFTQSDAAASRTLAPSKSISTKLGVTGAELSAL